MANENPIRTLGDYSKPSHEGYRNTIELHNGNNVVPLRSDTIRLVQNRCSFHGLRSEEQNQHLKDFLKLVDSLDLDVANRKRTRLPFEDLVMNFILDQEERVKKLEEYMKVIRNDFMQLSLEVIRRKFRVAMGFTPIKSSPTKLLQENVHLALNLAQGVNEPLVLNKTRKTQQLARRYPTDTHLTMSKRAWSGKNVRGQSFSSQERTIGDKVREFGVFDNDIHQVIMEYFVQISLKARILEL
ncbi:hypothetical protein Tco_0962309 [Tanacetum coccineum]